MRARYPACAVVTSRSRVGSGASSTLSQSMQDALRTPACVAMRVRPPQTRQRPPSAPCAHLRRARRRERIGDRVGQGLVGWEVPERASWPYGILRNTPTMRPSTTTSSA